MADSGSEPKHLSDADESAAEPDSEEENKATRGIPIEKPDRSERERGGTGSSVISTDSTITLTSDSLREVSHQSPLLHARTPPDAPNTSVANTEGNPPAAQNTSTENAKGDPPAAPNTRTANTEGEPLAIQSNGMANAEGKPLVTQNNGTANAEGKPLVTQNNGMANAEGKPLVTQNNGMANAEGKPLVAQNSSTANVKGEPLIAQNNRNIEVTKTDITIVVAGKSGAGKTTLIKRLLGITPHEVKMTVTPNENSFDTVTVTKHGVNIQIIDTTGFNATEKKKLLKEMSKYTKGKAVDLLLYCLPINPGSRFEDHNPGIMKSLQIAFGKDIWQQCMVVLTFSNLAWDKFKKNEEENGKADVEAAATPEYKTYIADYVESFGKELERLKIGNVNVASVYDDDVKNNKKTIVFVPAGDSPTDQVLPGFDREYEIQVAPDRKDSTNSDSSDDKSEDRVKSKPAANLVPPSGASVAALCNTAVRPDTWTDLVFSEIIRRGTLENNVALLQWLYGTERLREELRLHGIDLINIDTVGPGIGGGVAVGVTGAAVGGGTGAMIGLVGGPIGMGIGLGLGVLTGILVGSMLGGVSAAVVFGGKKN